MSFIEIVLAISTAANIYSIYTAKEAIKNIQNLKKLNSYNEEILSLERCKSENISEKFEEQEYFCMLQRNVLLDLLYIIDKETIKLDELKDLSKDIKTYVTTEDTTTLELALNILKNKKGLSER
jgi:hypothetical protein